MKVPSKLTVKHVNFTTSKSSDKDEADIGSHGYQIHLLAQNYKLDVGTGTAWKQWRGRLNERYMRKNWLYHFNYAIVSRFRIRKILLSWSLFGELSYGFWRRCTSSVHRGIFIKYLGSYAIHEHSPDIQNFNMDTINQITIK